MAAGLGFKTFNTGDVLSAADVNGYLMQGVLVFASTAARDAAITAPAEGQFAFTKDTNSLFYYDGAAWVASGATGDIEGVTAGTGISGGGTSGTVTITNSMATAIDAKGDLVVGTGADTFSKLTVGANGTTLVADSSTATGLKWAAAAAGGKILQVVSTNDNTKKQVTNSTEYTEIATAITPSSASSRILILVSFGLVSNSTNADSGFRIKRDSTAIQQGTGGTVNINQSFFMAEGASEGSGYTIQIVDSPATTSAITYKVELLANTGTININRRGLDTYYAASSSMTLMEIGA